MFLEIGARLGIGRIRRAASSIPLEATEVVKDSVLLRQQHRACLVDLVVYPKQNQRLGGLYSIQYPQTGLGEGPLGGGERTV